MTSSKRKGIFGFFGNLAFPKVYAPIGALAATVLLVVTLMNDFTGNPYASLLPYEPLAYRPSVLRGGEASEVERMFSSGMEAYSNGNYEKAAGILEKAVADSPDNWKYWMYLGICRYIQREPEGAIQALMQADRQSKYSFKSEIRWYLVQSYLLDKDIDHADSMRQILSGKKDRYDLKADSLLERTLNLVKKKRMERISILLIYLFLITALLGSWRKAW